MSAKDNHINRRVQTSSVSTVISISLVLFMLALVGLIVLTSEKLSSVVKENIGFAVYFKDNTKEIDVLQMQKFMEAAEYVKSTTYISKEDAVKMLREDLDPEEDFLSFLDGNNPLPASINVTLNAQYANEDSIAWIEKQFVSNENVKEIVYSKSLVHLVSKNVRKISLFILALSSLLFIIAIVLINNTIRLSIYSKRFLIRTMQLVGATTRFIRRPFIIKGISHGIYAAFIAILLLIGVLYAAQREIPELIEFQELPILGYLFGAVILLGLLISWLSTMLAVRRYLKLRTDELYY